jgi:hypothetical protein
MILVDLGLQTAGGSTLGEGEIFQPPTGRGRFMNWILASGFRFTQTVANGMQDGLAIEP